MRGGGIVLRVTWTALALVLASVGLSGVWQAAALPDVEAAHVDDQAAPAGPDIIDAIVATTGAAPQAADPRDPPGYIRLPKPSLPPGPRRVGLQAGHWLTQDAPPELGRVVFQTGTSWGGITEVSVNLATAQRVAAILTERGIQVDVLPTTIPPGYLADAFVALHADGDGVGAKSGFKAAYSTRRTPFEDRFMQLLIDEYASATELGYDANGVSRAMLNYYAHAWSRIRHSTSPFTPSVILEMGYLSNAWDRHLMVDRPDLIAQAIAVAILRFLDETPRSTLFGADLVVPPSRPFRLPFPPGS